MNIQSNDNFNESFIQNGNIINMIDTVNESILEDSAFLELESIPIPVFSANEIGKVTLTIEKLKSITGYDYAKLPLENSSTQTIYDIYQNYPRVDFLPIINESGWIVGYFTRKSFLSLISENNYNRELLFRKDVKIKFYLNKNVICLNAFTTLSEASDILMDRPEDIRFDPFVVTLEKKFFGISTVDKVLKGINVFLKRDLDTIKEAQLNLSNFFKYYEERIINPLDFVSYIQLLQGPGGDFVHKYEINNELSLVILMDVCGKGLKASSMIFTLVSMLNKQIQKLIETNSFNIRNFNKELGELNDQLVLTTASELYATGMFLLINKKEKILIIYDFGHGLLWVKRKDKVYQLNTSTKKDSHLNFFGIYQDIKINPISYQLKENDIIFGCSDGITEQMDINKNMYITKIPQILRNFTNDLNKNKKILLKDWTNFRQNRRIRDDVSFFIFKI